MAWSGGSIGTCDDAFRSGAGAARRAEAHPVRGFEPGDRGVERHADGLLAA